jgi:hypothetical protein
MNKCLFTVSFISFCKIKLKQLARVDFSLNKLFYNIYNVDMIMRKILSLIILGDLLFFFRTFPLLLKYLFITFAT